MSEDQEPAESAPSEPTTAPSSPPDRPVEPKIELVLGEDARSKEIRAVPDKSDNQ